MRTIIRWPMQDDHVRNGYPDGIIRYSYQGQANLSFSGLNASFQVTSSAGGVTTHFAFGSAEPPGDAGVYVTGVNAANPLKNLPIIQPGCQPSHF